MYAVSSEIGCTALNGAMAVDIPAGGQSVILALDKKIVIDGDDAAKFVEVRWGTNTAVGSRPVPSWLSDVLAGLISIVGDDNFDLNYIPAENKLYLQFDLEVTNEQIAEVKVLLQRVLPEDLGLEMEWVDGLPCDYKRLEYLESTGTQWIDTDEKATGTLKIGLDVEAIGWQDGTGIVNYIFGSEAKSGNIIFSMDQNNEYSRAGTYRYGTQYSYFTSGAHKLNTRYSYVFDENVVYRDGEVLPFLHNVVMNKEEFVSTRDILLFASYHNNNGLHRTSWKKVYSFSIFDNAAGVLLLNYVPALNPITKQPGMFDTVNKEFKTNAGSGDFDYPGKETESTTYSLRNRMYGKITEHGIRRLYCIPEGYNSKEEYAEENGFKLLVEMPMPEEGYWNSVWHDREDCIELEWVEVEPITEEETPIEEIENA